MLICLLFDQEALRKVLSANDSLNSPVATNLHSNHLLKESTLENGVPHGDGDNTFQMHESISGFDVEKLKPDGDSVTVAQFSSHNLIDSKDSKCSDDHNGLDSDIHNMHGSPSPRCNVSGMVDICDLKIDGDKMTSSNCPFERHSNSFQCTACDKVSWEAQLHPVLKVNICLDCKNLLKSKMKEVWLFWYCCIKCFVRSVFTFVPFMMP